jgi:3-mercaptopyruvate sulfurtransferase SseA
MKKTPSVLVDADWLDAHLHDPAVRVVEVDVSRRAHDEWHIDGAVFWDVYRDLKDARAGPAAASRPRGRARRDRPPRTYAAGRALPGRVPGRAVLALRRPRARRPGRPRPVSGPPAHRRPVRRAGAFRDAAALRGVFAATDLDGGNKLITYCTIGGRARTAWFVLTYLLGRDCVQVYDGSWAEWGRMPEAPVEQA